jgi:hypothetical protein
MSSLVINGDTSGSITLAAPAVAGSNTITLPTTGGTALTTTNPKTGNVLQVVQAYVNSGFTTTTSTTYVATALSGTITPSSASSKIYIIFSGGVYQATSGNGYYGIFRNGSNIANNQIHNAVLNQWSTQGGSFLDSPATTSAITYAIYMRSGSGTTTYFGADAPLVNSITMMEIAA